MSRKENQGMKMHRALLAPALLACALAAQAQAKPPAAAGAAPARPAASAPDNGVRSNPEFEAAGKNAAQGWLMLLDRKDWGTAWDASSGVFRQNVPLGTWMDNVPKLREPFGALVERSPGEPIYTNRLPGRPDGDYVTISFVSKFANKPQVLEMVTTVRESDGRWRVTGYGTQ
jgi:Protein of unknown function (DUF4019)